MSHKSINDEEFEKMISIGDSYKAMYEFLVSVHGRGELETGVLLSFIGLLKDGGTADPAQLDDYLSAVETVQDKKT